MVVSGSPSGGGTGLWQTGSKLPFFRLMLPPVQSDSALAKQVPRIVLTDDQELIPQGFPGWHSIDLGYGWQAEVSAIAPWIRPEGAHLTFARDGKQEAALDLNDGWTPPSLREAASGHVEDMPLSLRADLPGLDRARFDGTTVRYEFKLEVSGDDAERDVWILNYADDDGRVPLPVGWSIEAIEGLDSTIDASRLFATVRRGATASGTIRLVHPSKGAGGRFYDMPPEFFESRPSETALRAAVNRSTWVYSKREKVKDGIVLGPPR